MRIIPAIDIIDGKCVRLTKGNYETQKIYSENPLEMAKKFENSGIEFLHLVDLDGAKFGKITNQKVLYQISKNTNLKIDFGGGLKTNKDLEIAFENGAKQITAGSIAVKNPELLKQWILKFGNEKIILGADVHNEKIAISGWTETSEENAFSFIEKYKNLGLKKVICTDISKDGMLEGPSFLLYEKILKSVAAIDLIASGGITTIEDLNKLKLLKCEGAIIGKAIYEGRISLKEIEKFITQ